MNKLLFILLLFIGLGSYSQQKEFQGDPDSAFEVARNLAFNSQRQQAQDTLRLILTKYPDYLDIRAFLASTYSWDGSYKKARKEFDYVLNKDSDRKDTWIAAINNDLWDEKPFRALENCRKALLIFPNDKELLYKQASAEELSNNPEDALETLNTVVENYPDYEKAIEYRNSLKNKLSYNSVGVQTALNLYSEIFDPAQYYGIDYTRQTKRGSIIARTNFSRRFETNGVQFQVDLYPKISKGMYAYLNLGFSPTDLFPKFNFGGELYKSLPKSFEASLGIRGLKYDDMTMIYTGSLGWYTGNSYLFYRPYITPNDQGSSFSSTFGYRKYRSDADNYFAVTIGMGFSPELNRYADDDLLETIINMKSQKAVFGYYFTTKNNKNALGVQFGIYHQEKSFDPGSYYWMYTTSLSWDFRFR